MPTINATVSGTIEANRFLTTTVADSNPETLEVKQTGPDDEPDFYTRRRYTDGQRIYLAINPSRLVWLIEADGAIERGQSVANGPGGKLVGVNNDDLHSQGTALESGSQGDLVRVLHQPSINASLVNTLLKQSGGSSYTSEMARDDVANMLIAGSNVSLSRDDAGNTLTVSASDTQFSGQWADITGKPNNYPPAQHGDGAHGPNYATTGQLFSGNYADLSGVSVTTGDLAFDPATQSELNGIRQGVAHSATATASGDGTKTAFTLAHGLSAAPSAVSVQPTSADAAAQFYVSNKTASNVEVTYASAPASGTDNLTFDIVAVE